MIEMGNVIIQILHCKIVERGFLSECHASIISFPPEGSLAPWYSKTCLKRSLKNDKTKILMTNCNLIKVESIAECSPWYILQYF